MLMTYYTDNILYNKGIKQLPHFENLLYTFAMQYKIKVQGNCETVCLLSKLHEAKHHVNVRLDMDELDLTSAESKATYEEIKAYVAEHNDGMKVSNLYIAQVKANSHNFTGCNIRQKSRLVANPVDVHLFTRLAIYRH